ncbi:type II secretion system protein GspD [Pasteurella skyensis]|uniref:Type II secretion system protein GspD n=1 Tax=Phocoenobacter skyensis TaxID=97481 RepID=A0AAJ6P1M8_9PAST|nr:type II secretion system protein GspD [Pasteurella skyensis]MDP8163490.1 type II secretion system protein GspD [Pasteurella skyensis]MDP8173805.1 type II secretion system protein GspD [Pasteurella skyensis]MDP8179954.1 type II secretion system protein GspD [Pasteurella skyensis]MDP8182651.1 type II secretion system protein GspD [Pasteurella skyensis]MDP8182664.1 type II secretion system protein GspD [Pasteurella skyensis]
MNNLINFFSLLLVFFSSSVFSKNVDFKLDSVALPNAISVIYDEVLQKPFMLDPKLSNDKRLISFHTTEKQDFKQFLVRYFNNMNIKIYTKKGVDYIMHVEPRVLKKSFVYSPVYRDVEYLAGFINDGNGVVSANGDKLVYYGTHSDISRVKSILRSVDVKSKQVVVTGYVFEVQNVNKEGSGINLLAKLLSGKLGISIGIKQSYENFITVNAGNLDAMIELFRTDSRFKVLSSPTLRVKSGENGKFSVGSDVPVLGNLVYQDGKPVQSIEYRTSGVIFDIIPTVKKHSIDLKINQQLSNFVKTVTGVNNSPTLIKRDIVTNVSVKNGDVVVLGGLAENKDIKNNTGFSFLPFVTGKSKENTKTDIIVLLQVKEV